MDAQRAEFRPTQQYERDVTCTDVYMFCGPGSKSNMTLKKPRKDKRESHNSRGLLDENPRRVKERPSWLSISRQPSSSLAPSGSWKQVTCHLRDEAGQAILRLYTEDQNLQHCVQVNSLFGPNIRVADPTLLTRHHVLGIHYHTPSNASGSTSNSTHNSCEPIYLDFRNRETLNAWLVLLRSFAHPDIRPHPYSVFSFSQTGSYRMWRQIQVQIIAGRRFPDKPATEKISSGESLSKDQSRDSELDIWEIYFELTLNGVPVGRTGLKHVPAAWKWECITATDPDVGGGTWAGWGGIDPDLMVSNPELVWGGHPIGSSAMLEIRVWRAKSPLFKMASTTHIASIPIDLGPFRRGEPVKAWWPGFSQVTGQQDGEIMLEIRFDEEIVLPLENYRAMKAILSQRNCFELWKGLVARTDIPNSTLTHLVSLALHQRTLADHLSDLAFAEINYQETKPSTLFRGNSFFTRLVELSMAMLGARGFLEASIGHVVRKMYREKVTLEPGAGGAAPGPTVAAGTVEGVDPMTQWLREMWGSIWGARSECPEELRQLFYRIRVSVDRRWGSSSDHADLKYQAISAFLFLRFFVPALLRPDQHGLIVGPPSEGVERSLKSLARALQSLANLNTGTQRDHSTRSIQAFHEENVDAMIDYLIFVSTPSVQGPAPSTPSNLYSTTSSSRASVHELQIRAALQARLPAMSQLHRESLPVLPYMTDEGRDLAAIASAVVRNTRTADYCRPRIWKNLGPTNDEAEDLGDIVDSMADRNAGPAGPGLSDLEQDIVRFVKACFDVQAEAMRRVAPAGKKQPRSRRRRTEDSSMRVDASLRAGTSTPSAEKDSTDGREFGPTRDSFPGPSTGIGPEYLLVRGEVPSSLASDPSSKPEIVGQPSHPTVSSESKKRKGVYKVLGLRK